LFLFATLLFGALGCSKKEKEDPSPAANAGSYQLNSRAVTGGQTTNRQIYATAKAFSTTDQAYDHLEVQLLTSPQPASGLEALKLYFSKLVGQPATAYRLDDIVLYSNPQLLPQGSPFSNDVFTLLPTDKGFTGTFSGSMSVATGFVQQVNYTLVGGTFSATR
jgi:hypothetical protein